VNNVSDQFHRYCLVVASLQHDSLRRVADIVEAPPAGVAYDTIKQRLLASHQMTGFQRAERLFAMPALGARKPSELMAEMLEICPRGEEKTELFACLFLQRLPREIRVLLARVDHKDPKELAEQADHFWGLHDTPSSIAAVTLPGGGGKEQLVAAVRTATGSGRGRGGRGRHGGRGGGGTGVGSRTRASYLVTPGWPPVFAWNTGDMGSTPTPVSSLVRGRKTARPGATKRRCPWRTSPHHQRQVRPPVPGRHGGEFFLPPA
jgi:hypothetical protein